MVPVARDGSVFTPALQRRSGFWVGDKGAEKTVETFEEALDILWRMPVPRWRRPNHAGNWGIVAGVEWIEVEAEAED